MIPALNQEVRYRILKYVADHPDVTQRELANELGVSLGKANYCLRALMEKGLLKVRTFSTSKRKSAYAYILTPKGIDEKINVTYAFLRRKISEYDLLSKEIEKLTDEVRDLAAERGRSV